MNIRDLSILNHWKYLDKASKINGRDIFTTDVIGMLKFINAFKYNYTKPFKYRFEFYDDYFDLIITYNKDVYIKIQFTIITLQNKYRWYITSSLRCEDSGGIYNNMQRYFTKAPIYTVLDMVDTEIRELVDIACASSQIVGRP